MSSICSIPTETLSIFGFIPAASSAAVLNCACVVDAELLISVLLSPTFTRWVIRSRLSTNLAVCSLSPLIQNESTPPNPFLKYLLALA